MKEGHILDKVIKEVKELGEDRSQFLHEHPVVEAINTAIHEPGFRREHPIISKVEDVVEAIAQALEPDTPVSER